MATLGQKLKAAREAKGVSEQEAGAATKTLTKMIIAMEADDFSVMAAPTYAKGFIRLYAAYLGLNPEPLIEEYMAQHAPGPKPLVDEESQLEQNRGKTSILATYLKRFSIKIKRPAKPRQADQAPAKGLKPYVARDLRALAIGAAALLVVIVLIVSASNCVRRHTAEKPAPRPTATPARKLLDKPLPDIYLVEPGKIESSR
jgi:hypothetical protein